MILLPLLAGCTPPEPPEACAPDDRDMLVVASTDFSTGAVSALPLDGGAPLDPAAPAGGDPVVVALDDGSVALLERGGADHLRLYEPGCWGAPRLEVALGEANPHDAVLHDGLLWLTLYEHDALWALDPEDGERELELDLSGEADADGLPEADRFVRRDGRLFVALQRLERPGWASPGGRVVEVDEAGVRASHPVGPSPDLFPGADGLVVLTGLYGRADGALSVLDPDTGELVELLTEAEAGFDFVRYVETDGHAVLVGAAEDGSGRTLCRDLAGGAWIEGPSDAGWMVDAVAAGGVVWIGVRSGWGGPGVEPGLVALDPRTCRRVEGEALLLEPYALAVRKATKRPGTRSP